jgi:hypothetical protein
MRKSSSQLTVDASIDPRQENDILREAPQYTQPVMYVMGRTGALLQGSGRHKNDDTGSPGFIVDQY